MAKKPNQQIYQPGQRQPIGNIQPGPSMDMPNNSLTDLDFIEEMNGWEARMRFRPVSNLNINITLEHQFRSPTAEGIDPRYIERGIEDFFYVIQNYGLIDGEPRIGFGGEVEERSGPQSPIDSYYYQGDGVIDVMTIEGENITEDAINNSAENLIKELKENNHLI